MKIVEIRAMRLNRPPQEAPRQARRRTWSETDEVASQDRTAAPPLSGSMTT